MAHFLRGGLVSAFVLPLTLAASADETWKKRGAPSDISRAKAASHATGRELFEHKWTPNDPRAKGGDGLGPMYNDVSCVACHSQGGTGGGGAIEKNVILLSVSPQPQTKRRRTRTATDAVDLHPGFASKTSVMLHRFGTSPEYAQFFLQRYPTTKSLSRTPKNARTLDYADVRYTVNERNSTALFGAGRLASIPDSVIVAAEQDHFPEWPTVRGRAIRLKDGRVARFGWKPSHASLRKFVETACAVEVRLQVADANQATDVMNALAGASGEDSDAIGLTMPESRLPGAKPRPYLTGGEVASLARYVASLPAPTTATLTTPEELATSQQGEQSFHAVGCAACHRSQLGEVKGAYTDLLVHNLGDSLAETSFDYYSKDDEETRQRASASEWRTPPLWGVGDSAPYLHDGRAETIEDAIELHSGTAQKSVNAYFRLSLKDRQKLLFFLGSLKAPRGEDGR